MSFIISRYKHFFIYLNFYKKCQYFNCDHFLYFFSFIVYVLMHLHNFQQQKMRNFHSTCFIFLLFSQNLEKAWTEIFNLPSFWRKKSMSTDLYFYFIENMLIESSMQKVLKIFFHFKIDSQINVMRETQLNNFSEQNCEIIFQTKF